MFLTGVCLGAAATVILIVLVKVAFGGAARAETLESAEDVERFLRSRRGRR